MAEEEQGFTFTDKRGAQADPAPVDTTPAPEAASDAPAEANAYDDPDYSAGNTETAPHIYSVLGYCLSLLASEAWQKLGLIADPKTGEAQPDLAQAKVAIDAAGDLGARLEAGPAEIVPDALKRDLRTLLQDLRLNFVAQQEHTKS